MHTSEEHGVGVGEEEGVIVGGFGVGDKGVGDGGITVGVSVPVMVGFNVADVFFSSFRALSGRDYRGCAGGSSK